jgi:signal transduction histidine kinase/CheY-like chemotaxis protein
VIAPGAEDIASLSRELVIVTDDAGKILWTDERASTLIGARPGRTLANLCIADTADKAGQLAARAARQEVRCWELSVVCQGKPAAISFCGRPWQGNVLLVGQAISDESQAALLQLQGSMDDIVDLNREVARQRNELGRYADDLAKSHRELQDSHSGVLALHRELDDRAEALSRSSEIKSRVVSSVSHEFRTPLHSILGLTQLLLDGSDGALGDEQKKQVRFVRESAEELMALVNDLLDLSKIEAGKASLRVTKFSAQEFLVAMRGALRPLLPESSPLSLVFEEVDPDFEFETDRAKVSQIIRNLVSNALKFTEAGQVTVAVRALDDGRAVFTVTDTGIGIPAEQIDDIFEEFSQLENPLQSRAKGTGLGLPISRRMTDLLGGDIIVDSTVGEGTCFTVTLPRVHPDVVEMKSIEDRNRHRDPARVPVLVVEDDRRSMFVYERFLSNAGFQVIPARTVDAARAALATGELPAAVVLDVMLEEETTWRFLAEVKRDPRTQHVPVLVVTVTNKSERARALGADEFWLKPIDQDRLLRKLKSVTRADRLVKVLVVDDDARARYLIRKHVEDTPYAVLEASNGVDAVRIARAELPQVILLDFLLEETTAFDVLDDLKADPRTRGIPVIIVTSHVLDEQARRQLDASTEAIISKRNLSRELAINRIRDALRKGGVETRL